MGGSGSVGLSSDIQKADPYAWRNVLALPLVGNATDVGIACTSTIKTVTATNAVASSAYSNFYGGSFVFDGTGDNLTTPASSDFNFAGGDYTIEWWQWWNTATGYQSIFDVGYTDADSLLMQSVNNESRYYVYVSGSDIFSEAIAAPLQTWTHYALVRNGNSVKLYRNGIVSGSATNSGTTHGSSTHTFYVGGDESGYEFNGYIQDFRVYKGVAKYTKNFIPASTNPDILPDTPSGVAYSSELTKVIDGAVYFDGTGDYLSLADSADWDLGDTFTIEAWVNLEVLNSYNAVIAHGESSGTDWYMSVNSNGSCQFYDFSGTEQIDSSAGVVAVNTWNHIAISVNSGTAQWYVNGTASGSSGSLDVQGGSSSDLTIGIQGTIYPFKGYISNLRVVKGTALYNSNFTPSKGPLADVTNTKLLCCQSNTSASDAAVGGSVNAWLPSGFTYWTDGMSENWAGSGGTTSGTDDYINVALPTSGKYYFQTSVNNVGAFRVVGLGGGASGAGSGYFENMFGYYYNNNPPLFITKNSSGTNRADSVTHGASSGITQVDGGSLMWAWDADNDKVWLGYEGTWFGSGDPATGTNASISGEDLSASSFYLKLGYTADSGSLTLTNVESGDSGSTTYPKVNGDAEATTFNPFTDNINTVMGQETGYATWNHLDKGAGLSLGDGNLKIISVTNDFVRSTLSMSSGKWYFEYTHGTGLGMVGLADGNAVNSLYLGQATGGKGYGYYNTGTTYGNDSGGAAYGASYTTGDVIGVAFDADAGVLTFYNNNISQGAAFTGLTAGPYFFAAGVDTMVNSVSNFGQKPFRYAPPEGHKILNYANLPSPEVVKPDQYVGIVTYTGDGNSPRKIEGFGFQPDLVVYKERSEDRDWQWYDSVRGVGPAKNLCSNTTYVQDSNDDTSYGYTSSFDKDGFTVTDGSSGGNENIYTNKSGETYVSYCWKAGGNKDTFNVDGTGYSSALFAGLAGGSLSVTGASVGTKQGFSIIKFTGTGVAGSVSHGLTQKPDFIIAKNIDGTANNWGVHHSSLTGPTYTLYLDGTAGEGIETLIWPSASTDSLINVGSGALINENTKSTILYSWHDIPGLQKFGKYVGTQSTNGPFVELGFRPALLMIKAAIAGTNWRVIDNTRRPYNWGANDSTTEGGPWIKLNSYNDEDNERPVDLLSNGFKVQGSWGGDLNYDSGTPTYIYAAWAEQPMNNFYGAQSNAR